MIRTKLVVLIIPERTVKGNYFLIVFDEETGLERIVRAQEQLFETMAKEEG